jgi:hypothetical protein
MPVVQQPKAKGDRATLAVMLALQSNGWAVLEPFGENTRYDLVIDDGARLIKVQCKNGRLRSGAIVFATCSCYGHHRNPGRARRSYQGEIDAFGVYCPDTGGVYLVPVEMCGGTQAILRVSPPANNQRLRVRWAADYEIGTVTITTRDRSLVR